MATDDPLQEQRERNDKLREQLAQEQAKLVSGTQEAHDEVEQALLEAEGARLEAELAAAKDAAKKSTVRAGAALPLAQAKEQMKQAVARKENIEKAPEQAKPAAPAATQAPEAGRSQ